MFYTDRHEKKVGNSVEDREFLLLMDQTFHKNSRGNWIYPGRKPRPQFEEKS